MQGMKRIFIALKVDAETNLLRTVSSLKQRFDRESIKWTNPENIHITLIFLGDTEEEKIGLIRKMLAKKCDGFGNFNLTLKGAGVFRNYSDPRILWIGIESSENLIRLNSLMVSGLRETGIITEDRPFNPHLTLGRIKRIDDKQGLKSVIEEHKESLFQHLHVTEVILYESILKQAGPLYIPLGKYSLIHSAEK